MNKTTEPPEHEGEREPSHRHEHADGHHHHHHHHHSSRPPSYGSGEKANMVSAVCVGLATIGLIVYLITVSIATANHEPLNKYFGLTAGAFALFAFLTLFYAILLQIRARSRTVRNRILASIVMIAFVGVSLLRALDRHYRSFLLTEDGGVRAPAAQAAPVQPKPTEPPAAPLPEDTSLYKPGWYGEKNVEGIQFSFSSFAENAKESRDFNKRVPVKVAYGMLSVVNRGNYPVVLPELSAEFVMDSGNAIASTPARPLLEQLSESNRDLLPRMKEPLVIRPGEMFPDLPICHKNTAFPWANVKAVKLRVGRTAIYIPGRMVSASEKQQLMASQDPFLPAMAAPESMTRQDAGIGISIKPPEAPASEAPARTPAVSGENRKPAGSAGSKDDFSDL